MRAVLAAVALTALTRCAAAPPQASNPLVDAEHALARFEPARSPEPPRPVVDAGHAPARFEPARSPEPPRPVVDAGHAPARFEPARSSIDREPAANVARAASEPGRVVWERSEPDARARARREARPLLVYLRADWAADALWMERGIWSDPRVVLATKPFVAVVIDVTGAEGDAELYAQRYAVERLPTVVLFDDDGRRVASLSGAQRAEALIEALRSASE